MAEAARGNSDTVFKTIIVIIIEKITETTTDKTTSLLASTG